MTTTRQAAPPSTTVSFEDLKSLAAATPPCITAAVMIPTPAQIQSRLNNAVREIDRRLGEVCDDRTAAALVEPIHALMAAMQTEGVWATNLVLFRTPAVFRHFSVDHLANQFVTVGDRFQIRPLLPLMSRHQRFHLLALSQKHVRLFLCTWRESEEISLKGLAPQNLQTWLNTRIPDHVLENRATLPHPVGSMKGVVFGTSTDREREDEYLAHFFKEIDKGVHKILLGQTDPLILAGVDTEIALYRKVNTYPHVAEQAVTGSPDGLSEKDLHQRALEIVRRTFSDPLKKVIDKFDDYRNAMRVSIDLDTILKAGEEGRIDSLLLVEEAEQPVQETNAPPDEDRLNIAALQTLLHRGQVFALHASEMPDRADAVAVLRF